MSYLVLARKWRPKRFDELVGQEHVVRALTNALETGRVHHAFLFTGTRGVGKTTIARIFAKSLNCERGTSAEPCGECASCLDIDAGRFVDLLEIDAASNTGVDDVRALIENAQYMPARGRTKVYLIDEVHMLSKHAFNALLKTLEEPPGHVKFLLATTDPQKLPVTVLSRCLQFNLRRLEQSQIAGQMSRILQAENIDFEPGALAAGDGGKLMAEVEDMAQYSPDFGHVLEDLATELHRIQLHQLVPGFESEESRIDAAQFAVQLSPELVQLWYQMAVNGRRDLGFAPSPRAGFEMALLRMLAFRPVDGEKREVSKPQVQHSNAPATSPTAAPRIAEPMPAMASAVLPLEQADDWLALVGSAGLKGPVLQLGSHSAFCGYQDGVLRLFLPDEDAHLRTDNLVRQLTQAASTALGVAVQIRFENKLAIPGDTLHLRNERQRSERQLAAEASFLADPVVSQLLGQGGSIVPDSIRPLNEN